jgi:hypothetical protein
VGETRTAYRVLVGKPEGKRLPGRPKGRWKDNIKIDIRETVCSGKDWLHLA